MVRGIGRRSARLIVTIVTATLGAALVLPAVSAHAAAPSVTAVQPVSGSVGDQVTVVGSGFAAATAVTFNGVAAPFSVVADGEITATVPAGAATGPVAVTTLDGTSWGPLFTVVARPTAMRASAVPAVVTYPGTVTLAARLVRADNGVPVAGQPVQLWAKDYGTPWRLVRTLTTDGVGLASYVAHPGRRVAIAWRHDATSDYGASQTSFGSPLTVIVRPLLTMHAPYLTRTGVATPLWGSVRPVHPGAAVRLERYASGAWHGVRMLTLDSNSDYHYGVTESSGGSFAYRVSWLGDGDHAPVSTPYSRIAVTTRDLGPGMAGADVAALQRRLATLHYDIPGISGSYGYDTQHAVLAFEKANGTARNGVVSGGDWVRLAVPVTPRLRYPTGGRSIEIDLTRQVLLDGRNGSVSRILDVSTGSGQVYYSQGYWHTAVTPTGHFEVSYEQTGWQWSPLGELYWPAYFTYDGYAIHGSDSVPAYPASHGCVRITVPAMDRLWGQLFVGESVRIYRS